MYMSIPQCIIGILWLTQSVKESIRFWTSYSGNRWPKLYCGSTWYMPKSFAMGIIVYNCTFPLSLFYCFFSKILTWAFSILLVILSCIILGYFRICGHWLQQVSQQSVSSHSFIYGYVLTQGSATEVSVTYRSFN